MNNNVNKLPYTLAANFGNMVAQLQLQIAKLETDNATLKQELSSKDDLIKELQHKITNLEKK
ncbi:hypothetical protein [Lactobacillus pasteurii]|uniref:Uncharacterized protein n=1 Tax=Lactobacillus pasteurii DSM 23907 = CRBIP 24.76 TaxID=1423790 RepID=I7IZR9_9LACO|nr:hypothetical protein [Lactobacillus pasteurii]TDG76623.1 hypothetical protein C5L33_001382 [Lactobacillus pasteurii]CCI85282.1 Predicted protein [Lactobacillus pasteurii DSM 23907 = CRBIP 24.76]